MPEVSIEEATFERLQRHAQPLVDTIDTVLNRALDALERSDTFRHGETTQGEKGERHINPRALPRLTHTKVLDASIGKEQVARPNWNSLLIEMLIRVMKRVQTFEKLTQVCPVNVVRGRKADEGYRFIAQINASVQGQDANGACRAMVTAAQALSIPVNIGFMWRHKKDALFPGERARLQILPRGETH